MKREDVLKAYLIGLVISCVVLVLLGSSTFESYRMPGKLNTGHEKLACNECHQQAPGNTRQQIQTNLKQWLGFTEKSAAFHTVSPDNKDCLACHQRDNDRHPVYRFNEPRFEEVRKILNPQNCVSCHREHSGKRVTSSMDNCIHCHEDTVVKNDTIETPHATLIKQKQWQSCLGCHDFHGNHEMQVAEKSSQIIDSKKIQAYFAGGEDPYSPRKTYKAKETRYEN